MQGWDDLGGAIFKDSLPAKYGHLYQKLPESVMAGNWTRDRKSQVQSPNHYTTEPPMSYEHSVCADSLELRMIEFGPHYNV